MGATCACVLQAVGWRAGDCAGARRPERRTARTRTAHKTQRDASRGGYAQRCGAIGGASFLAWAPVSPVFAFVARPGACVSLAA
jgi:hypothetical protein